MNVIAAPAEETVCHGAAWLDQHIPGWADLIDLDKLDISSCVNCVAGQIRESARADASEIAFLSEFDPDLGFDALDTPDIADDYAELDEAWRAEIASRAA